MIKIDLATGQWGNVAPNFGTDANLYTAGRDFWKRFDTAFEPKALYVGYNCILVTRDGAQTWKAFSPDLTTPKGQPMVPCGVAPAAAPRPPAPTPGAPTPTPTPAAPAFLRGSISDFSLSTVKQGVIWSGSSTGQIYNTMDGGKTWTNVTNFTDLPANLNFVTVEAGHSDVNTAYVVGNIGFGRGLSPEQHFIYRTHDGGKTWTRIVNGLPVDERTGSQVHVIREDPKQKGLLFSGTETTVYVSFDDGDHWQSLRQNMPAISVRDLQIKDDAKCHCADLIAGTHGRGFWILDNVTPLRQAAAAKAALAKSEPYLFKPGPAVRVRFGVNEPTPWPPELPAGESAPPGALIDYYLAKDASSPVQLEILDASGKVVRTYSSAEPVFDPDPGKDMAAYDEVCKKTPTAAYCGLPLYWPAPQFVVSPKAGMHRFSWDLKFDPVSPVDLVPAGDEEATGAVPGRTYPNYNVPWVPPGSYTVRLTVGGATKTQPIVVRLDPRVRIAPAALATLNTLSTGLYWEAVAAHRAFNDARSLAATLATRSGASVDAIKGELEALAPTGLQRNVRVLRRRGAGPATPSLEAVSNALQAAAMAMQAAEVAPTATQLAAAAAARAQARPVMARWAAVKAKAAYAAVD
jgi:photosystem II stability/assembly factor-like uncharacterized protein